MKPFYISEIGVNFEGSFEKAKRMVLRSAQAGAHAVKFQKYDPKKVLGPTSPFLADAHQLSWEELKELSDIAHFYKMQFGCSVFDIDDIKLVDPLVDFHKIATRMNKDEYFRTRLLQTKKKVIMSIQKGQLLPYWQPYNLTYMWCVAEYPSKPEQLKGFLYSDDFGLSSHCPDIQATIDAVKAGARTVEHHVCEHKSEKGCDIAASITFEDFKRMTDECNAATLAR